MADQPKSPKSPRARRPSSSDTAGDPSRPKKIQHGFVPSKTESIEIPSANSSRQASALSRGFSPDIASYKSQIPGWSGDEGGGRNSPPSNSLPQSFKESSILSKSPANTPKPSVPSTPAVLSKSPHESTIIDEKQLTKAERKALKAQRRAQVVNAKPEEKQRGQSTTRKNVTWNEEKDLKEVALFMHLANAGKSTKESETLRKEMHLKGQVLHPAIVRLGSLYKHFRIVGSNARCVALMNAFREVIRDYRAPPNSALRRHLDLYLKPQINYLVSCRPMSVSMGNAIRFLKLEIADESMSELPEDDAKKLLDEKISTFIRERILCAGVMIGEYGSQKIVDDDVILTFGNSSSVRKLLITAHRDKKINFRVIVADSRPLHEGKTLVKALVGSGLTCTYIQLNALSFVMKNVSKVFIGAHGMLSNGALMSRAGTSLVAMLAHEVNVPVIVCCETYKFSDRVQLDSFVHNELGDPDDLVEIQGYRRPQPMVTGKEQAAPNKKQEVRKQGSAQSVSHAASLHVIPLSGWRDQPNLKLLHLLYDVTPSSFITMVITEVGLIPCSSVPVVIREGVKAASSIITMYDQNE